MVEPQQPQDEKTLKRLFIGNISEELHADIEDLKSRLSKFGNLKSDLEIHKKPTAINYFAYLNIDITTKEYSRLKAHLNGVKFKNSKLIIDIASQSWVERAAKDRARPDTKEADRLKRDKIAKVRAERIARGVNRKDEIVIKGRLRKTGRKNLKSLTLRCYLNGKLMTKMSNKKTKVWGYDKDKKLRDLTWVFENSAWKTGTYHVVERPILKRTAVAPVNVQNTESHEGEDQEEDGGEEFVIEQDKNTKILGDLFANFDFDKPVGLFEEVQKITDGDDIDEESGASDYEFEARFVEKEEDDEGRDSYDVKVKDCAVDGKKAMEEYKKANMDHAIAAQKLSTEDEDEDEEEDEDVEMESEEDVEASSAAEVDPAKEEEEEEKKSEEEDSNTDDEFMPTFGTTTTVDVSKSENTNDTDKLRSLFNPESSTGRTSLFNLEEEDSDIDEDNNDKSSNNVEAVKMTDLEEISLQQQEKKQFLLNTVPIKTSSLFFTHTDSPFLQHQSQLTKLTKDFKKEEEYETWFYEKRGELNREFRRHKRDHVRQFNKKKHI